MRCIRSAVAWYFYNWDKLAILADLLILLAIIITGVMAPMAWEPNPHTVGIAPVEWMGFALGGTLVLICAPGIVHDALS